MRGNWVVLILLSAFVAAPVASAACAPTNCVVGLVRGSTTAANALLGGALVASGEANDAAGVSQSEFARTTGCASNANPSWTLTCAQGAGFVVAFEALDAGLVGGTALLAASLDAGYALTDASVAVLP